MGNMMKQAKQMQAKMAQMQEELALLTVTGQAGGGMVEVTINGKQTVEGVKIDPKAVDPEDMEMLEDLMVAAFNDAQARMAQITQEKMSKVTGGMNIPGLF
ncbi:YbaB/EbfC family nucleoid-associated protein [Magnetococcus sp. PR-3]|uniref:YbaB/EbfC family nucleoid-associated protein n=1 Tax=Magnetococcus sp. PR-3 TaxID=3120355 RepID=UPI002FCDEEA2